MKIKLVIAVAAVALISACRPGTVSTPSTPHPAVTTPATAGRSIPGHSCGTAGARSTDAHGHELVCIGGRWRGL